MGISKMAKVPRLVGEIGPVGMLPKLIGTVIVLEEDEKEMVKGLIINKFRGEQNHSGPSGGNAGREKRHSGWCSSLSEYSGGGWDSLTERFETKRTVNMIDIAVIRVPRISNFTDLTNKSEEFSLRYVEIPSDLEMQIIREPEWKIFCG